MLVGQVRCVGVLLFAATAGLAGCATTVRVDSNPPGADVLYQGKVVGQTPGTIEIETGGVGSSVELEFRKGSASKTVTVPRSETNWGYLGLATALDTGVCLGVTALGVVVAVVAPPCAPSACAGVAAYLALPLQFYLYGARVPDSVSATFDAPPSTAPAVAVPPGENPPPAENFGY